MLERVREDTGGNQAVYPFLLSLGAAALQPGEAIGLRVDDVTLPEEGLGELLVRGERGRKVPVTPKLAGVLRHWISSADLGPGDRLFPGEQGGPLSSSVYRRVWRQAREAVLRPDELEAGLGEKVSGLREVCLVDWLRRGLSAWGVAEWAGVSASWLALRYPQCFRVDDVEIDWDRLEEMLDLPDSPEQ
ncbi:hypothetical protein IOD14_20505 [Streptomyces sp. A2-16]|uniref:hypothetical protein n=1 Tax=Streptomyces sp. A2-16 TaxID=2781734 RepID=UPI001BAE7199|nr:hypothetical protein [Streptomyces sp. A2-16]QUC58976.1 hypothetical protein IOD14_20505 [Streptomyces sp. A2-16]